jgi:hypothetical protein
MMDTVIQKSAWAWYRASIMDFLVDPSESVIGKLVTASQFPSSIGQRNAWLSQIELLKNWLEGYSGEVLLEFTIPRLGSRIDAVVLIGPVVFVIEFKVGAADFDYAAVSQVWDYALDLKNFHEASHFARIVPILVATEAKTSPPLKVDFADDLVCAPVRSQCSNVRTAIDMSLRQAIGNPIDPAAWSSAAYRPTPTIIEAARALYAKHSVQDIARHDAGARNLHLTSTRVDDLIRNSKANSRKSICFVTGVPGAGKTLVGLNIATQRRDESQPTHAVFLSGNEPLVAVLREALLRDEHARRRSLGEKASKARLANPIKSFIQNVHHFRDAALNDPKPPHDHVVIFDEAQRAWNRAKTEGFMKTRKGRPNFPFSEPAFLISYMDRHADWAVIICLVGGGQEIHTGEAGIGEWMLACSQYFPHWDLHISSSLTDSEYDVGPLLDDIKSRPNASFDDALHLAVSMRSFRAEIDLPSTRSWV